MESVRAWVMSKTDSLLHILVFCQHSDSSGAINEDEIKVELLSYGCDPDAAPNLVAAFGLNGEYYLLDLKNAFEKSSLISKWILKTNLTSLLDQNGSWLQKA